LSRLIPNADCRVILVIRHRQDWLIEEKEVGVIVDPEI
jgi:hypothetical protein